MRKDKASLDKIWEDTNRRLKNFCQQKGVVFIASNNLDEQHLSIKKLHLNKKKNNTVFTSNILKCVNNWLPNLEKSFDLLGETRFY